MTRTEMKRVVMLATELIAAVGPRARWQHDRMFGIAEAHNCRDSAAVGQKIAALRRALRRAPASPSEGER